MAKRYPREFRDDVVRVARLGDASRSQIARDFGISEPTLYQWLRQADVEDGVRDGVYVKVQLKQFQRYNLQSDFQRPEHHCRLLLSLEGIWGDGSFELRRKKNQFQINVPFRGWFSNNRRWLCVDIDELFQTQIPSVMVIL